MLFIGKNPIDIDNCVTLEVATAWLHQVYVSNRVIGESVIGSDSSGHRILEHDSKQQDWHWHQEIQA